jgi:hypothetical protein
MFTSFVLGIGITVLIFAILAVVITILTAIYHVARQVAIMIRKRL